MRLVLLSAHYQPFDFTKAGIEQAKKRTVITVFCATMLMCRMYADAPEDFIAALCDDLNTPKAMAELAQIAKGFAVDKTKAKAS